MPVIEEMTPGAFSVASTQGGLVSLRINLGYQSASMSAYPPQTTYPPAPTGKAIVADDGQVTTNAGNYTPTGTPLQSAIHHLQRESRAGIATGVGNSGPTLSKSDFGPSDLST